MKVLKLKSVLTAAIAATCMVAGSAMAVPTVDIFLNAYLNPNSGAGSELAYLNEASGKTFVAADLHTSAGSNGATFDMATQLWVIDVAPNTPGYFLLKFGNGGTDAQYDTYIFENIPDLTQLVWSNDQVANLTGGPCSSNGNGNNCNIGRLSHITWVPGTDDGGGSPGGGEVPEPASLALLGAGLAGMLLRRRRG